MSKNIMKNLNDLFSRNSDFSVKLVFVKLIFHVIFCSFSMQSKYAKSRPNKSLRKL